MEIQGIRIALVISLSSLHLTYVAWTPQRCHWVRVGSSISTAFLEDLTQVWQLFWRVRATQLLIQLDEQLQIFHWYLSHLHLPEVSCYWYCFQEALGFIVFLRVILILQDNYVFLMQTFIYMLGWRRWNCKGSLGPSRGKHSPAFSFVYF